MACMRAITSAIVTGGVSETRSWSGWFAEDRTVVDIVVLPMGSAAVYAIRLRGITPPPAACPSAAGRGRTGLAHAAAGDDLLASEPLGVVRGEEHGDGGNVIHLTNAAERSLSNEAFLEVGSKDA